MHYEYKIDRLEYEHAYHNKELLNKRGAKGWILCAVQVSSEFEFLYFMRPYTKPME